MDSLAVGALLALATRGPNGLSSLSRWAWPIAGATAVALSAIFVWPQGLNSEDMAAQAIGYTSLVFLFGPIPTLAVTRAPETALGNAFASPGLMFFGR